ncbi:MAG: RIP metalloprotease RseP [Pseudomonadota bacterium]
MDLGGLIPSFGNVFVTLGAFILALSIIVAIHEYGHYIVGRWSGIHAEVFSLGFGPVLFQRTDRRGTVWQVAAVPLGGFVKFKGDANAASAPEAGATIGMSPEERRTTMQGAPLWARAATVSAGPIFNFILSIIIFTGLLLHTGVPRDPLTVEALTELPYTPMELQEGDELISIGGVVVPPVDDMSGFWDSLPEEPYLTYEVRRDGAVVAVEAPHPFPAMVSAVRPLSAALAAGLEVGDVITSANGAPIVRFNELVDVVTESEGGVLTLGIWRDGESMEIKLQAKREDLPLPEGGFETRWLIGIEGAPYFENQAEGIGVVRAAGLAVTQTWNVASTSISMLYNVVKGEVAACNVRGAVTIARVSGDTIRMGWVTFIGFIAVISTAVGLLNLFPIPVLDGGHLLFHAWEAVTGKPPSDQALRVLMTTGLTLILGFMAFALFNDFFCP